MARRHKDLDIPEGISPDQAFVQILDPAAGTGTFLVEAIDLIFRRLTEKWRALGCGEKKIEALWNEYVPEHLLPRLHGYELLMAPYTIAHLKIGLKLYETGYRFSRDERARIYLTNALEPAHDFSGTFEFAIPALAHEAKAVNEIKRKQRYTVVIGNPPYSASISEPEWLMRSLVDWKEGLNETKSDLNREEWKFLRFAQYQCTTTGAGILGFIINRDFLDGIAKRRMREHLGRSFPLRIAVDLNGDVKGNIADENVFEIEQGVAIAIFCTHHATPNLRYASRVGTREQKYADLIAKTPIDKVLKAIDSPSPYFRWVPYLSERTAAAAAEYSGWPQIKSAFGVVSSGIQTKRDALCIAFTRAEMWTQVQRFRALPAELAREEFGLGPDGRDWTVAAAKADLAASGPSQRYLSQILYRPFDIRFTYWTGRTKGFLAYPRREVMQHVVGRRNVGMIFNRQIVGDNVSHFGVARTPICHGTFYLGNKGQDYFAPMLVFDDDLVSSKRSGRSNLTPQFVSALRKALGSDVANFRPDDVLHYVYAIFHSSSYRRRYAEFLKIDFPRLPLPGRLELFGDLAQFGDELVALHLMESPKLDRFITTYTGPKNPEVGRVGWSDDTVWLDASATKKGQPATPGTIGFRGVPEGVWNFHIGGYQVCQKWLKDRKGRTLSDDDIAHYQKIVVALAETIRLMQEIDEVIEQYGGWPGAFAQAEAEARETADTDNVVPLSHLKSAVFAHQAAPLPLQKAAEPEAQPYEAANASAHGGTRRDPDEQDHEDLICRIRHMFGDGEDRERDAAIGALVRELGCQDAASRIHTAVEHALRIAIERSILVDKSGGLRLSARNIEQYERHLLKEQFLASLSGRPWIERDEAIRAFARWMGFRRTGRSIDETARSLINGLLREGRLERQDQLIRRSGEYA
jgi:predicted helicase